MANHIRTLTVVFDTKIHHKEIPLFRGAVLKCMGAWLENIDKKYFKENIVPKCRPKNNFYYKEYDFPKSRRVGDEMYLFGFVKLEMLPE